MTPAPGHRRIWPVLVAMTAACTAAAVWLGLRGNADASWWWLAGWLALATRRFLEIQRDAGASVVQLFDSWAGSLAPADYRNAALPASAAALDPVRALRTPDGTGIDHVPLVHFGVGTGEILADMASIGVDAIGVDHRVSLDDAVGRVGGDVTVQGNLDPALLAAPAPVLAWTAPCGWRSRSPRWPGWSRSPLPASSRWYPVTSATSAAPPAPPVPVGVPRQDGPACCRAWHCSSPGSRWCS